MFKYLIQPAIVELTKMVELIQNNVFFVAVVLRQSLAM
jgi:hypothetical protein